MGSKKCEARRRGKGEGVNMGIWDYGNMGLIVS
jgi:hypothetical protein